MIELGPDEALEFTPEWVKERFRHAGGNAAIGTTGDPEPRLLADLDGERVGRARMKEATEIIREQMMQRTVNWTGVAYPNAGWAEQVFGEPDVERLWEAVAFCVRLDEDDPVEAWNEHMTRLETRAKQLTDRRFDALHYRGPGTDFTVGLLPNANWIAARYRTADGRVYVPNMPTEEIFTTPDSRRADGTIRSSKPLSLNGQIIRGLEFRLENGRIVDVEAEQGAELVRSQLATVENADRLGELALVTGESRVGQSGTLFFDTLFDENATCHIAYGMGLPYAFAGEPDEGSNVCNIHIDFMVGAPELEVDAVLADGTEVPLIRHEEWQLSE
jgi:aminopeptidase